MDSAPFCVDFGVRIPSNRALQSPATQKLIPVAVQAETLLSVCQHSHISIQISVSISEQITSKSCGKKSCRFLAVKYSSSRVTCVGEVTFTSSLVLSVQINRRMKKYKVQDFHRKTSIYQNININQAIPIHVKQLIKMQI